MISRHASQKSADKSSRVNTSSRVNFRYLKSPEKSERYNLSRQEVKAANKEINRLQKLLEKATQEDGLNLSSDIHDSLFFNQSESYYTFFTVAQPISELLHFFHCFYVYKKRKMQHYLAFISLWTVMVYVKGTAECFTFSHTVLQVIYCLPSHELCLWDCSLIETFLPFIFRAPLQI